MKAGVLPALVVAAATLQLARAQQQAAMGVDLVPGATPPDRALQSLRCSGLGMMRKHRDLRAVSNNSHLNRACNLVISTGAASFAAC